MATPAIALKPLRQTRPHGVSVNIADQFKQIAIGIEKNRFVSATKQWTITLMNPIESLGIDSIDVPHASG